MSPYSWKDVLGFVRWQNLLIIIFLLLIFDHGLVERLASLSDTPTTFKGVLDVLMILDVLIVAVIGYAINDLADVEADKLNRPNRLLVRIPELRSRIRGSMLLLGIVGLAVTVLLGYLADRLMWVWLYPLVLGLLLAYGRRGKRWGIFGNIMVSLLIAVLPGLYIVAEWEVFLGLIHHQALITTTTWLLIGYFGLMFFSNLAREVIKDAEDIEGDRSIDAKTLPILIGNTATRILFLVLLLCIGAMQAILAIKLPDGSVLSSFSLVVFVVLLVIFQRTRKWDERLKDRSLSLALKLLMLIGLLQLMVLPAAVL